MTLAAKPEGVRGGTRGSPTPIVRPEAARRLAMACARINGCTKVTRSRHAQSGTMARVRTSGVLFISADRVTDMNNFGRP